MNYLIVIPARLKSTRLPNKPLIKIKGKEILLVLMSSVYWQLILLKK